MKASAVPQFKPVVKGVVDEAAERVEHAADQADHRSPPGQNSRREQDLQAVSLPTPDTISPGSPGAALS